MAAKYIFLDTWTLSCYTRGQLAASLSRFIVNNDFTILFDSLALVELYNPEWEQVPVGDRTDRITKFLGEHKTAIVDPRYVFMAEIQMLPESLKTLPIRLDMARIPLKHRTKVLLMFLRRDPMFLEQGKDIARWAEDYEKIKSMWIEDSKRIISNACESGTLRLNARGEFVDLKAAKEEFLLELDRRHFGNFNSEELRSLSQKTPDLWTSTTRACKALRFSSLCFWYGYIESDPSRQMARRGSDIGDLYQMSLVPYCHTFVADKTMYHLIQRVNKKTSYMCRILNNSMLKAELGA